MGRAGLEYTRIWQNPGNPNQTNTSPKNIRISQFHR